MVSEAIKSFKDGNQSKLEEIYKYYYKSIFSLCFSYTKNTMQSEDLVQDTFYNISKYINKYEDSTNFLNWILKIAQNLTINFLNRQKRETVLEAIEVEDSTPIFKSELFDYIKQFLNEVEYQIVTMHLLGDIKFNEIAKLLDKNENTIRWKYHKAIKKLKSHIKFEDWI